MTSLHITLSTFTISLQWVAYFSSIFLFLFIISKFTFPLILSSFEYTAQKLHTKSESKKFRERTIIILYLNIHNFRFKTRVYIITKKMLYVLARVAKWNVHIEIRWQPNESGIEKAGHE